MLYGKIENIGAAKTKFHFTNNSDQQKNTLDIKAEDHNHASGYLIDWLEKQEGFDSVKAIGHRIVNGMQHTKPEIISDKLLIELKKNRAIDPEHLPEEIKLIEIFKKRYPAIKQVACFDTSFHTSMPMAAKLLSIPRRYYEMGIRRYGFHGLSYTYLMEEIQCTDGEKTARSKIVLAHLGSGASLAAVKRGKSIDTSMGFTPTSGLPMGTRSGDLDPGAVIYLIQKENRTTEEFSHIINYEAGLLGISGKSADMRELMKVENTDLHAAQAIELFCYQTKKGIGSFAAALGGLDLLVFTGGIGENSPEVRTKICEGLEFLGIKLDEIKNMNNKAVISAETGKVKVRVIKTNEELIIAKLVLEVLPYQ